MDVEDAPTLRSSIEGPEVIEVYQLIKSSEKIKPVPVRSRRARRSSMGTVKGAFRAERRRGRELVSTFPTPAVSTEAKADFAVSAMIFRGL